MRNFVSSGIFLALCLVATPFLGGQVVDLTVNNNCGTGCFGTPAPQGTLIGTITVAQGGNSNTLTVTLQMQPGFTLKVQDGNDFNFNGPAGLTVNAATVTWDGHNTPTAVSFGVSNGKNVNSFGTFGYNITGIGTGQLGSVTSVNTLTLTITCSSACTPAGLINAFNSNGADFAIHFCDASGTNCSTWTGYAGNGGAAVPEPSILALLACSAVMFGGFFRRLL